MIGLVFGAAAWAFTGCQTEPVRPVPPQPPPSPANQSMTDERQVAATITAMEWAALDRWGKGDPSGFLEICAPDVVYFDPSLARRLDGLEALRRLYESIRGQIHIDRFELLNPKVQACGEAAVLTYNYVSYKGEETYRWNCTEVYRQTEAGWRIIQTHWSATQPFKK